jgi:hypothetical protein
LLLILLGVMLFLISSCGLFQDNRTKKRPSTYKKHKPIEKKAPAEVDTLPFQEEVVTIPELPEEDMYQKYGSEFRDVYRIALLLPLEPQTIIGDLQAMKADLSYRFINYYAGIQLALEDLSREGLNLEVEVISSSLEYNDSRKFTNRLNQLAPDLIIGPYERDLLREVAGFGRRKSIPVISPWQSSSKITQDNPFYIQLKPDIKVFYQEMVRNIDSRFIPGQVYILGREDNQPEKNRISYLQEVHQGTAEGFTQAEPYHVFFVEEDSLSQGVTAFDSIFMDPFYKDIAVIIPNWSFRDEQFIYSCMRKLNAEKAETRVHVYGMPIIRESDKIGFHLYKSLHVKLVMDGYADRTDETVKAFRKRYLETYHALPVADALEGYDMMMFVGRNLKQHGTRFQYFLTDSLQTYLQTAYRIVPRLLEGTIEAEQFDAVDYFENGHVDVWEFDYNGFRKMK